ncbi:HAMP domain-containing sensor histidine kinase [Aureibaculum sp. 2210JD6-5]|uniref:sensor histidine kinase n=1 Tax=Aureibaculum sp. 2210JD6-5 TaxID=3103957 RepID=UPI002AAE4B7D|nr:HAMP domain-containing sensor histidine kinase [Aureibaculum sp. 2210JD6-5]MDY7394798.1 HAMP domain-containing sensor histidine kinase [Aureibaculum sp. 2210JD6-5]
MKLIERTSRTYLWLSIVIFIVSAGMLIFVLTTVMNNRLDEQLRYSKEVISKRIKYGYPLTIFEEPRELNEAEQKKYPNDTIIFKDTLILRNIEGEGVDEFEKYRQLTAYETLHDARYKIVARNSLVRNQDFIWVIVLSSFIIILLLLIGLWILNTQISKKLWHPFYTNIDRLKNFSVQDQEAIELENSNIDEFKELNNSIQNLTQKLQSDFSSLKEFSENASHEMQTPLAIMQSKIELLLQSDNINKEQSEQLQSIYQAGKRLSKLNKTLLLLAKVENQQYSTKEEVSFLNLIEKQLENYEDFILNKNITVNKNLSDHIISTNTILADTLISNLLSNAIKHNINDGIISIIYTEEQLIFSNTGEPLKGNPEDLFNRFKKQSTRKDSLGLGLAIIKQICDVNQWQLNYYCEDKLHTLSVSFGNEIHSEEN